MSILRKTVLVAAAGASLVVVAGTPALAAPDSGKGTSLCKPAAAIGTTWPAGGPLYNFLQPPPASGTAFNQVCQLPAP